jgi:hypothetical protein
MDGYREVSEKTYKTLDGSVLPIGGAVEELIAYKERQDKLHFCIQLLLQAVADRLDGHFYYPDGSLRRETRKVTKREGPLCLDSVCDYAASMLPEDLPSLRYTKEIDVVDERVPEDLLR